MTDQPVDRPIDLRAELTSMLSVVDGNVSITREQMEAIGDHLQTLWGKAHDLKDNDALDIITNVWDRAQLLVEQNASLAFQVSGMGSIAVSALEGERATREALDSLEDAIDSVDIDHPRLQELAETIRMDEREYVEENLAEWAYNDAMECAYDDTHSEFSSRIQALTGCDYRAAHAFLDVLYDNGAPSESQLQLLKALIADFDLQVRQGDAAKQRDRQQAAAELQEWNQNGH